MDEFRCTTGEINKVTMNRRTHRPSFEMFFEEITISYSSFKLNYVMKYLNHIPAKYTTLAAQSIVAASNAAAAIAMPPNADQTETLEPRQLKKLPRKKKSKASNLSKKKKQSCRSTHEF
jgi:hypothetical protein